MSIEKREGKTETQNPVVSSAWFGNPNFIDSRISGPTLSEKRADGPSGHCARNISDVPTKHTKTNPQRPGECAWSPKPTGGNRVNKQRIDSISVASCSKSLASPAYAERSSSPTAEP